MKLKLFVFSLSSRLIIQLDSFECHVELCVVGREPIHVSEAETSRNTVQWYVNDVLFKI